MNRHFTLGWTSIFTPPSVLTCCLFATIATTYAQIRTVTQQPYPTGGNSVAWITNVPYVDGGGPQQQLDLLEPLIKAFLHHYLLDRRKDLFTGVDVTQSEATPALHLGR